VLGKGSTQPFYKNGGLISTVHNRYSGSKACSLYTGDARLDIGQDILPSEMRFYVACSGLVPADHLALSCASCLPQFIMHTVDVV
jgi:hypothetical protein